MSKTTPRLILAGLLTLSGAAEAQQTSSNLTNFGNSTIGGQSSGGATVPMNSATAERNALPKSLSVDSGSGRIINLPSGAANIFVADPKVVEVRPASSTSLFMFGVSPGRTTVAAMDASGHPVSQFEVTVRPSRFGASEAAAAIARAIPGSSISVEVTPKSLILTGQVKDAASAERAQTLAQAYVTTGQNVENRLSVASSTQVGLRVRIVEMSRSLTKELGINWQTLGSLGTFATTGTLASAALSTLTLTNGDINAVLNLLASDNLVRTLAEPNLIAQSGERASFLAGGEYPIPISQSNGSVSVQYKQFGVELSFVPTVLSDRRISLHVRPEVSDISASNGFTLTTANSAVGASASSGVTVPALTVRRADTTVELGSGQSFAIAGLLQDNVNHSVNALPFLGEVPVLGALFRSDSFQRTETELVIVVTPYIIKPVSNPMDIRTPDYSAPNDLDRYIHLRQLNPRKDSMPPVRSSTTAGFLVE